MECVTFDFLRGLFFILILVRRTYVGEHGLPAGPFGVRAPGPRAEGGSRAAGRSGAAQLALPRRTGPGLPSKRCHGVHH